MNRSEKESVVKVAIVQMEPKIGDKRQNLRDTCRFLDTSAHEGATIIVLPELCNTGYVFNTQEEVWDLAESIPEHNTSRQFGLIGNILRYTDS